METISQAKQVLYLVNYLKEIKNGIFVDFSASHPISMEGIYLFESKHDWDRISLEIDSAFKNQWTNRITKTLMQMHLK